MPDTHDTSQRTRELGERYADDIIALRRHFHQHPELSAKEHETSAYICGYLDELGIPYKLVTGPRPADKREERDEFIGTGIIATIRGEAPGAYDDEGNPAKRVALRCDMDALPVTEKTNCPLPRKTTGSCTPAATIATWPCSLGPPVFSWICATSCVVRYASSFSLPRKSPLAHVT